MAAVRLTSSAIAIRAGFIIGACLGIVLPRLAVADEFAVTPYRPTVSTPAALSAPGWLELEAGLQRYDVATRYWRDGIPYTLKLAFTDDWGIRLGGELLARIPDPNGGDITGFGDTSLVLKRRFALNDTSAFGLEAGVEFPTARPGLHSGSSGTDFTVNGIYSADFGAGMHTDINLGVTRMGTVPASVNRDQFLWAIALSGGLGSEWGWAGEVSGTDQHGVSSSTQLLLAASYSPRKSVAWDFGVARSSTSRTSSWSVLAGGTFLLSRLF